VGECNAIGSDPNSIMAKIHKAPIELRLIVTRSLVIGAERNSIGADPNSVVELFSTLLISCKSTTTNTDQT